MPPFAITFLMKARKDRSKSFPAILIKSVIFLWVTKSFSCNKIADERFEIQNVFLEKYTLIFQQTVSPNIMYSQSWMCSRKRMYTLKIKYAVISKFAVNANPTS